MKTRARTASRRRGAAGSERTRMLQAEVLASSAQTSQYASTLAPRVRALRAAAVCAKLLAVLGLIAAVAVLVRYLWPSAVAAANGTGGGGSSSLSGGGGTAAGGPVSGLAFSDFDQNGDGKISEDEVRAELESRGFRPTDQELHVIMVGADADSSGAVGPAEFDKLVAEVQKVTGFLTPLLPWWAYLLILLGVIGIVVAVAWYAWRSSKWMLMYWAIFAAGVAISILESQLYGVVFGKYVAGLGAGLIVFTYFLRYMKRTFVDPVAEKMNKSAEWAARKATELTDSIKSVSKVAQDSLDYVTGKAAGAIESAKNEAAEVGKAAKAVGEAGTKVVETGRKGAIVAAKNPTTAVQHGLNALDKVISGSGPEGPPTKAQELGQALEQEQKKLQLPLGFTPNGGSNRSVGSFVKGLGFGRQGSNSSTLKRQGSDGSIGSFGEAEG